MIEGPAERARGRCTQRRIAARLWAAAALALAAPAMGQPPPAPPRPTGATILANQPGDLVGRLMTDGVVVLQEVRESGPLSGAIITAFLVFQPPIDRVYRLLSQTTRHGEFRPEVTSIVSIRMGENGPLDEHRLKILFRRYVYRVQYRLDPTQRRIEWELDEAFDNDLAELRGLWELYPLEDGRTLARFGTRVDVGGSVPSFLQDWITRKNLPGMMERVRRWVDSDGTYRP